MCSHSRLCTVITSIFFSLLVMLQNSSNAKRPLLLALRSHHGSHKHHKTDYAMSVASSFAESTPFLGVVSSVSLPPSAAAGLALSAAGDLDLDLFLSRPLCSCVPHRSCLIRWVLENDISSPHPCTRSLTATEEIL